MMDYTIEDAKDDIRKSKEFCENATDKSTTEYAFHRLRSIATPEELVLLANNDR